MAKNNVNPLAPVQQTTTPAMSVQDILNRVLDPKHSEFADAAEGKPTPEELAFLNENVKHDDLKGLSSLTLSILAPHLGIGSEGEFAGYGERFPEWDTGLTTHTYNIPNAARGMRRIKVKDIPVNTDEWIKQALWQAEWGESFQKNLGAFLELFDPWGSAIKDPSGKNVSPEVLFPNIANLLAVLNELGITVTGGGPLEHIPGGGLPVASQLFKLVRVLERGWRGVEQETENPLSSETPMLNAIVDYYDTTFDFNNPQNRNDFDQKLREDPIGIILDAFAVPGLLAGGGATALKVASGLGKLARRAPIATKHARVGSALNTIGSGIDKSLNVAERVNVALNGGFKIPGAVPFVGGKTSPLGAVDIIDPGMWVAMGAGKGIKAGIKVGASELLSREVSGFAGDVDVNAQNRMRRRGIDPKQSPAAVQSKSSRVANIEAVEFIKDNPELVRRMIYFTNKLDESIGKSLDEYGPDVPLGQLATELANAFTDVKNAYRKLRNQKYGDINFREDVAATHHNVIPTLKQIMSETMTRVDATGTPNLPPEIANLIRVLEGDIKAFDELNDYVDGGDLGNPNTPAGGDSQPPPSSTKGGQSTQQVRNQMDSDGTPNRVAYSPDYRQMYDVVYEAVEMDSIIASHVGGYAGAPRTPADKYRPALQPKEIDKEGHGLIEYRGQNLVPSALINDTEMLSTGAPILTVLNEIAAGNHRFFYLVRALQAYPERWAAYQDFLLMRADAYGLDPKKIAGMKNPVLIRRLGDGVDAVKVAEQSNRTITAGMGAATQAAQDAHYLTDDYLAQLHMGEAGRQGTIDLPDEIGDSLLKETEARISYLQQVRDSADGIEVRESDGKKYGGYEARSDDAAREADRKKPVEWQRWADDEIHAEIQKRVEHGELKHGEMVFDNETGQVYDHRGKKLWTLNAKQLEALKSARRAIDGDDAGRAERIEAERAEKQRESMRRKQEEHERQERLKQMSPKERYMSEKVRMENERYKQAMGNLIDDDAIGDYSRLHVPDEPNKVYLQFDGTMTPDEIDSAIRWEIQREIDDIIDGEGALDHAKLRHLEKLLEDKSYDVQKIVDDDPRFGHYFAFEFNTTPASLKPRADSARNAVQLEFPLDTPDDVVKEAVKADIDNEIRLLKESSGGYSTKGAKAKAKRPSLLEIVKDAVNAEWAVGLFRRFDENYRKGLQTKGQINDDGYRAIVNIILRRTFEGQYGTQMLASFLEMKEQGMVNVQKGVMASPELVKLEMDVRNGDVEQHYSIAEDLSHAIIKVNEIAKDLSKTGGGKISQAVSHYLNQQNLPGMGDMSETARQLMPLVVAARQTPTKIADFVRQYSADIREGSVLQNSLFADSIKSLSKEAATVKIVDKVAGSGKLSDAIDDILESDADDLGGLSGTEADGDLGDAAKVYTFKMKESARTQFRELAEAEKNPTKKRWYRMLEEANDLDMQDTGEAQFPDKIGQVRNLYKFVKDHETYWSASLAQHILRNIDSVYTPKSGEDAIDNPYKLLGGLVHPHMTPDEVHRLAYLFKDKPDKWMGFQRYILKQILNGAYKRSELSEMARRQTGEGSTARRVTSRHSPMGVASKLANWVDVYSDTPHATLEAWFGRKGVDTLNDLDVILQGAEDLYRIVNGSQTFRALPEALLPKLQNMFFTLIGEARWHRVVRLIGTLAGAGGVHGGMSFTPVDAAAFGVMTAAGFLEFMGSRRGLEFLLGQGVVKTAGIEDRRLLEGTSAAVLRSYFMQGGLTRAIKLLPSLGTSIRITRIVNNANTKHELANEVEQE